jgi:3-methyladenine DNA glycosylase AlkD
MIDPVSDVRVKLKAASDEKTRVSGERFFKENVSLYGVRSAIVAEISKQVYKEISDKDKSYIFALCEEFWKSGMMEESFVACNWSYNVRKQFNEGDIVIFERWINSYVTNWASCDTFCNHTVGDLVEWLKKQVDAQGFSCFTYCPGPKGSLSERHKGNCIKSSY